MNEIFQNLYEMTAFSNIIAEPQFLIMYAIAFILLYLGIKKQYEPLLLVPIAFGVLLANFPGGDMGVIQADENGMINAHGVMKNIWDDIRWYWASPRPCSSFHPYPTAYSRRCVYRSSNGVCRRSLPIAGQASRYH